ncbi:hypothetical protein [Vibrio fortis]|uniref:hypothetical protein n=1 Tax=Vibrio fortis TaxID=212667 RepID=UPI0036F1CEC0
MFKFYDFLREIGVVVPEQQASHNNFSADYHYSSSRYQIEEPAKKRIADYLSSNVLKRLNCGDVSNSNGVIAFSFGDSDDVNQLLAKEVERFHQENPLAPCYVQQEVAAHLKATPHVSIENSAYQTTTDVARAALNDIGLAKITVIAQSWHAQRCIETCESLGFEVVALRVSDGFPAKDPQPWVRNPINWIIKESHREVATGYEISEQFNLV